MNALYAVAAFVALGFWLIIATVGSILFAVHDAQRQRDRQMEREWARQWGPDGDRE